ncbi:hypothetical protein OIDMADRAFT_20010 [Oidiodendron maius Zn]|uniref:Uncharacterized protein n=1 Tax=Oidiodendron maius (strain Zn) TaxID=913774 RepID=A0A0C3HAA7_OIDMZ|nr:hypothetical protein OIDMADRAFT_20010 [Oidiodendron maius Zn]
MAQTNSTAVPPACQGTAGSLPELPFPMSCGTSSYDNGNATIGQSVLASCCAGNPIAEFGNTDGVSNCWVYCNATNRAQESEIWSCLLASPNVTGFGCEGQFSKGAGSRVGRGWGPVLALGLLVSMICQL